MIKVGLCSVTFRKKSMQEIVRICNNNGLEGIEVGGDVHLLPGSPQEEVNKVRELCSATGIEIPSYGSYFNVLENEEKDFAPVLETASLLGADTIRIWPGWVEPEDVTDKQLERISSVARAAAEAAAEKHIRVAFEYHIKAPTCGAEGALRLLEAAGHDNLYTYFQYLEPFSTGENISHLKAVFPHLANVHCHYLFHDECVPLSQGREAWIAIGNTLKELGFGGYIFMEFVEGDEQEQLAEDVALLRELLANYP